ncbi:MAG: hypothetical protein DRG83_16125, partial [Deltaproteobacteria bacterium]
MPDKIIRTPVREADLESLHGNGFRGGVKRPGVTTGVADPTRARIAKKTVGTAMGGMFRGAGMLVDLTPNRPYTSGYALEAYRTSYANGLSDMSGTYDIPRYFVQMNEQNGGLIYWPVTLREKYQWYRYWARCFTDPNVLITKADGTEAPLHSFSPGDEIVNAKGSTTKIKQITQQFYKGEVVRFVVEGNRHNSLEVTPEHPFFVLRSEKIIRHHNRVSDDDGIEHRKTNVEIDFSPEWVDASDIREGDCFVVPNINVGTCLDLTIEMARLVGYYLAEGRVNKDRNGNFENITWSLRTHEDNLIKEVSELCETVTGKSPSVYNYEQSESGTDVRLYDRKLAEWFVKHCGTGSRTKRLSRELFNCQDCDLIRHLLACWLNGDGTREHDEADAAGRISGTTTSDSLAQQLYLMAVRAHLCVVKNPSASYEFGGGEIIGSAWRLRIACGSSNELSEYNKWRSYQTSHRYRKYNHEGNLLLPVREIKRRDYCGYIWNFETEGVDYEDRTFLVYGLATHNSDAYIGRSLELLADLPMSKLTLNMPKDVPEKVRDEIKDFFTFQLEAIKGFELCQSILWELNMIGNVYLFHEWDEDKIMWKKVVMLPPEEVYVFQYPFTDSKRVEYRPERLIGLINGNAATSESGSLLPGSSSKCGNADLDQKIVENIPEEIVEMVRKEGCIVMDSDPMTGSFVYTISRRRSPYLDLGSSVLERVLVPM